MNDLELALNLAAAANEDFLKIKYIPKKYRKIRGLGNGTPWAVSVGEGKKFWGGKTVLLALKNAMKRDYKTSRAALKCLNPLSFQSNTIEHL